MRQDTISSRFLRDSFKIAGPLRLWFSDSSRLCSCPIWAHFFFIFFLLSMPFDFLFAQGNGEGRGGAVFVKHPFEDGKWTLIDFTLFPGPSGSNRSGPLNMSLGLTNSSLGIVSPAGGPLKDLRYIEEDFYFRLFGFRVVRMEHLDPDGALYGRLREWEVDSPKFVKWMRKFLESIQYVMIVDSEEIGLDLDEARYYLPQIDSLELKPNLRTAVNFEIGQIPKFSWPLLKNLDPDAFSGVSVHEALRHWQLFFNPNPFSDAELQQMTSEIIFGNPVIGGRRFDAMFSRVDEIVGEVPLGYAYRFKEQQLNAVAGELRLEYFDGLAQEIGQDFELTLELDFPYWDKILWNSLSGARKEKEMELLLGRVNKLRVRNKLPQMSMKDLEVRINDIRNRFDGINGNISAFQEPIQSSTDLENKFERLKTEVCEALKGLTSGRVEVTNLRGSHLFCEYVERAKKDKDKGKDKVSLNTLTSHFRVDENGLIEVLALAKEASAAPPNRRTHPLIDLDRFRTAGRQPFFVLNGFPESFPATRVSSWSQLDLQRVDAIKNAWEQFFVHYHRVWLSSTPPEGRIQWSN